jgi:hypothetical protein
MTFVLRLLGWAISLCVLMVLIGIGGNIYNVVAAGRWTPLDQARQQLAQAGSLDLAGSSVSSITAAIGAPEYKHRSSYAVNADNYRWARGAVEAMAVGDDIIQLDIGPSNLMALLPLDRARFPGAFVGLKLGDPTPDASRTAQLNKAVVDCCGGFMGWRSSGGRVVGIYYRANTASVPAR